MKVELHDFGKDNNVLSKTPDEIKASLRRCAQNDECIKCAYYKTHDTKYACLDELLQDVVTLNEQLERERDAAVEILRSMHCETCIHEEQNITPDGCNECIECNKYSNWEWRGAKEVKDENA